MRIFVALLFLTNLAAFGWFWIDTRMGGGEGVRLAQQVQPNKISLLTPQQVAALGPAKAASLADVCVCFGTGGSTGSARLTSASGETAW